MPTVLSSIIMAIIAMTMYIDAAAATSGVMAVLILVYMLMGSVDDQIVVNMRLVTNSFRPKTNIRSPPDIIPGSSAGMVMCKKVWISLAPKLIEAFSRLGSIRLTAEETDQSMKGRFISIKAKPMPKIFPTIPTRAYMNRSEIPCTTSGTVKGSRR